jgi:heat shock protein HtpX
MWEEIRANKRRSWLLVIAMTLVLVTLGALIGAAITAYSTSSSTAPIQSSTLLLGAAGGIAIALVIAFFMSIGAFYGGSSLLLGIAHARQIEHDDHPQLFNVVEEMAIASGQAKLPKVYIIDDRSMNAFATGRNPDNAAIAVTSGLLKRMNRDQLQGVIAHEMSHIQNRDILFMTMLSVMVGTIAILSEMFLRTVFYSSAGSRRSRSSSSKDGGSGLVIALMVLAMVFAILAPILSHIIYFAASRRREYLADASAALMTRYPEGLASALELIDRESASVMHAQKATAPMYIANPLEKAKLSALGSTHPPTSERIHILRSMGGTLSYGNYQKAWESIAGAKADHIPKSALDADKEITAREASVQPKTTSQKKHDVRQVTDALRKANGFLFLACTCGMRIKLPPEYKKDHIQCPRCEHDVAVPVAHLATMGALGEALEGLPGQQKSGKAPPPLPKSGPDQPALEINRPDNGGWFTFDCSCGAQRSLSPAFTLPSTKCKKCGRQIILK